MEQIWGLEKFFDIKCRFANLKPDAVVLVATIRALKYNGGIPKDKLSIENLEALKKGFANLRKHIENIKLYNVPVAVTLNAFLSDTKEEIDYVRKECEKAGSSFAISKVWEKGGEGGLELAQKVIDTLENKKSDFKLLYDHNASIKEKIETIAQKIYGAKKVSFTSKALKDLETIEKNNLDKMPICIAKTQYSLSDDPSLLGCPKDFEITVRELRISAGAGFIVALTGEIMTMPGLPKIPAAVKIDINEKGQIIGLF